MARWRGLHPEVERSSRRRDGRPVGEAVTDRRLTTTDVWDEEARLLAWAERSVDRQTAGTSVPSARPPPWPGRRRPCWSSGPPDVLESATGCPSITLAKLLHDARHDRPLPARGATVVVDEAGMAATADAIARPANALTAHQVHQRLHECLEPDVARIKLQQPMQPSPRGAGQIYSMRRPEIAREITSCWICSVPSKMSMLCQMRPPGLFQA